MNKLTIEELAPYLAYYLTGTDGYSKYLLSRMSIYNPHEIYEKRNINYWLDYQIKPILRPLSDLAKEISKCPEGEFIVDGERIREWFDLDPTRCNYAQITYLLKNHYDVFDLIEKGLAIDINTIK